MISLPPRYSLIKELDGGGMSDTLLCNDDHLKRKVVIKSLKPGIAPHRLMDELSALAAIRSKHVVQVLDVIKDVTTGSVVGFVEEYIDGGPLESDTPSDEQESLRAIYPIAAGICDIHSHGRVHRDIKPDNMRYDSEGTLKIFDFGLAKIDGSVGTAQLYYTEGFSAPEVFTKDASGKHNFTKAVDVFAFGATCWWVLNGGVLPKELLGVPPSLPCADFHTLSPALPGAVADALNACLSADRSKRPEMSIIRDLIGRHLMRGAHRMLLTDGSGEYRMDATNPKVSLSANGAVLDIAYDGLDFTVKAVSGIVLMNNLPLTVGQNITGSVVIVMRKDGAYDSSITADLSYPEVIL